MVEVQDITMHKSLESRLEAILNAITTLLIQTASLKRIIGTLQHSQPFAHLWFKKSHHHNQKKL